MSTKNVQPGVTAGPTVMDATKPKAKYYNGQMITLLPTVQSNGFPIDPDINGKDLTVSVPLAAAGLSTLPGVDYIQALPVPFPSSGTWIPEWKGPGLPVVIKGETDIDPVWDATTDTTPPGGVKQPLSIDPPPKLETNGSVPEQAFGQRVLVPTSFLKGVRKSQPPGKGNTNQVKVSLQMLNSKKENSVDKGSGPFIATIHARDGNVLTLENLVFYDTEVGSTDPVVAPFKGVDSTKADSVWPRSDENGQFNIYIVPNDNTDGVYGWMELIVGAGEDLAVPSFLIIMPPEQGFYIDSLLDAPDIVEAVGGDIDISFQSTFSVTLPQYALDNIATGTRAFLMINGEPVENSTRMLLHGMSENDTVFNFNADNPLLKSPDLAQPPVVNTVQYVIIDANAMRASIEYPVNVYKSNGHTPVPGPLYPLGDKGFNKPVIRELKGMVLTGVDIVEAGGVHVDASWTADVRWTPKLNQIVRATVWLNGWHHGGEEVNQNTFSNSFTVTDVTVNHCEFFFTMDQFADYGPPATNANDLPSMQVQYYVFDEDGKTQLFKSPAVKISLDTIPAGV